MTTNLVFNHFPVLPAALPRNWNITGIGQIAKLVASGFPSGKHNQDSQGVPHIRPMNIDREGRLDLSVTKYVEGEPLRELEKGDVLFNNTNSPELVGKTTVIQLETRLGYSNHMTRIRLEDAVCPSFIARQLHFLWGVGYFRHRCANHVNQASISTEPLSTTVPVLLPPAAEQNRIADVLDELFSDLDAGVAALERVRDKLKLYRASVLKAAVEGTLTADWREEHPEGEPASELLKRILDERRRRWEADQLRKFEQQGKTPTKNWKTKYKEPVALDTADLPVLPKSWRWSNLDTVTVKGPQNGLYLPSKRYGEGTEILRIDDFQNDWVRPRGNLKKVQAEEDALETYALQVDDLVINRVNSLTHLGKCVIITEQLSGILFESNMMRAKLTTTCDAKYLQYYLHSDSGRRRLTQDAKWAVNQASINQQDVKKTPIPVPPLAEQEAIVEIVEGQLSVVNYLESEVEAKLQNAQALRQAILRHAFTGKLVPQNPNDEPASELLKRISGQRAARARESVSAKEKESH